MIDDWFVSDSTMPGYDNCILPCSWNGAIFGKWFSAGGLGPVGSPINNGGGPGHHWWGNGSAQDFHGSQGHGAIMHRCCWAAEAFRVHGAIWSHYVSEGGATGWLGYPESDESQDGIWRRSDFEEGYICWWNGTAFDWEWDPGGKNDC